MVGFAAIQDDSLRATPGMIPVHAALSQLRTTTDLATVFDRGVRLACEVGGFDRAMIFRVEGSAVKLERAHFPGDPAVAEAFSRLALADPPRLTHMLVETEMVRRRAPVLVLDAPRDPHTHKPLVTIAGVQSYVAAPILPEGKVIGFIHADRTPSGGTVSAADRDLLFAFAEGFGWIVERAVLLERLQAQRREIRRLARSAEALVDDFATTELQLAHVSDAAIAAGHAMPVAAMPAASAEAHARMRDLLTRREFEVLQLLADGMTNAAIAERLIISQATVKSHVQRILRKLRASNRAEAVSRYLRLQDSPG